MCVTSRSRIHWQLVRDLLCVLITISTFIPARRAKMCMGVFAVFRW